MRTTGPSHPYWAHTRPSPHRHTRGVLHHAKLTCIAVVCATVCVLVFGGGIAQAAFTHKYLSAFGPTLEPLSMFSNVQGIAVDESTGDVYVYDTAGGGSIYKFNAAGEPTEFSGLKADVIDVQNVGNPDEEEIAVDNSCFLRKLSGSACEKADPANGDIYAATAGTLAIYGADGKNVAALNGAVGGPWGEPCGVSVDSTGRVYVGLASGQGSGHVDQYNTPVGPAGTPVSNGDYAASLSVAVGEVCNIAADPKGDVYVDSWPGGPVTEYEETQFGLQAASGKVVSGSGSTLTVDPATQDVYVDSNSEVLQFGASGEPLGSFAAAGEEGSIGGSYGVAVNGSTGEVYVSDNADGRVNVYGPAVPVPGVSTGEPSGYTETGATVTGTVNPEGVQVTGCRLEYITDAAYKTAVEAKATDPYETGHSEPCNQTPAEIGKGTEPVPVSAKLAGLEPVTRYHYRLSASTTNGTGHSADATFAVPAKASIDSESVSNVTGESATLGAQINPEYGRTTYHFEYGTSASYGTSVPASEMQAGAGLGDVTVSVRVQGLIPGTIYHYRVVASNPLGAVSGPDRVFETQPAGAQLALPDGRQYELVSPPNKDGGEVQSMDGVSEIGGIVQAAENGGAVTYRSLVPFEGGTPANYEDIQYVSRRESAGWSTRNTTPPAGRILNNAYKAFSVDLSHGILEPRSSSSLSVQAPEHFSDDYLWSEGVPGFQPLVTSTAPDTAGSFIEFLDATPDLKHVVFASGGALAPGAVHTGGTGGGETNLFEWSSGSGLKLVSVLPGGGATIKAKLGMGKDVRRAISNDGSRVIFRTEFAVEPKLYERDMVSGETVQIGSGENEFQIASSDGLRVFFNPHQKNQPPGDLKEFDAVTGKVVDVTPDGEHAGVLGVLGASEDGSYVYVVADGVLTTEPNARGERASPGGCDGGSGVCNLYVVHFDGSSWTKPKFIGQLSGADSGSWEASYDLIGMTARVSPHGRFAAFMSLASLTGYDNRDVNSGKPDAEVYIYDAETGGLRCVSCNPTGARPRGEQGDYYGNARWTTGSQGAGKLEVAGQIPGWTMSDIDQVSYQSRYLSDDGRLFFDTSEALVAQDTNGNQDVYEYEPAGAGSCRVDGGCVFLISGGVGSGYSRFVDASETGEDVFFVSANRLVSQDVDNAVDMYDAHVCNAVVPCFATAPVAPPACTSSDACKAGPTPQPGTFGAPASATFSGLGNQSKPVVSTARKKAAPKKRKTRTKHHKKRGRGARRAVRVGRSRSSADRVMGRSGKGGARNAHR